MEKKINMEVSLSRNFDKISLGVVDEAISFKDEDDFKKKIKEKFKLLKELILEEFETKPQDTSKMPLKSPEMASQPQKNFLINLGYNKPDLNNLTKEQAQNIIKELLNAQKEGYL